MRVLFKAILRCALALTAAASLHSGAQAQTVRILALGDSLTQGYGLPPGVDFASRLERVLKLRELDVAVINAGVSGDTSAGGLARLDWQLADSKGVPQAAIIELGANDGLRGLSPVEMEKNLDAILAKLKARNIAVLLTGMKAPRNFGPQYAQSYDAVFPRLARKYGVLFYPFFLEGVALDRGLVLPDMLHPNGKGVEVIATRIAPLAVELVNQAKTRRASAAPSAR